MVCINATASLQQLRRLISFSSAYLLGSFLSPFFKGLRGTVEPIPIVSSMCMGVHEQVSVTVCVCVYERVSVTVCVCVSMCVVVYEQVSVTMCMCVCESVNERVNVTVLCMCVYV